MRSLTVFVSMIVLLLMQGCAGHGDTEARNDASDPVWIDVRTDDEYQAGHLDAAIHIPFDEIADRIAALELAPDQPVYLYCGSGRRAGIALDTLRGLGYTHLTNAGSLEQAEQQWLMLSTGQEP